MVCFTTPKPGRAAVEGAGGGVVRLALLRGRSHLRCRLGHGRRIVIASVLRNVIGGNIEAGGVGHVVDIESVLQVVPFLNCSIFTREASARFWKGWRKILRWPLVKVVSKLSPLGTPSVPGESSGSVKQEAFRAAPARLRCYRTRRSGRSPRSWRCIRERAERWG